jgi:hypothetical protein
MEKDKCDENASQKRGYKMEMDIINFLHCGGN